MDVNDYIDSEWERLLECGAVVLDGIAEDGEPIYTFDLEVLQKEAPEIYHAHLDEVDDAMINLVNAGLAVFDFTGDEVTIELTEKGRVWAEAALDAINET